jgi:hypothetical protein
MEDHIWYAEALCDIAAAQAGAGELSAALETARSIEDSWVRAGVLCSIARVQVQTARKAEAYETLATALEAARSIENSVLRAEALRDIIAEQIQAGNLAAALETVSNIEDNWSRADTLTNIAETMIEMGLA